MFEYHRLWLTPVRFFSCKTKYLHEKHLYSINIQMSQLILKQSEFSKGRALKCSQELLDCMYKGWKLLMWVKSFWKEEYIVLTVTAAPISPCTTASPVDCTWRTKWNHTNSSFRLTCSFVLGEWHDESTSDHSPSS